MSTHFGKTPCVENLIQMESGPSVENLVKEIRYSSYHLSNPGTVLTQSMNNNAFSGTPLGGEFTIMSHGHDHPDAKGMLQDIHPCEECPESCEEETEDVVENLKEEMDNDDGEFSVCNIIIILLLLALIVAIICKFREM